MKRYRYEAEHRSRRYIRKRVAPFCWKLDSTPLTLIHLRSSSSFIFQRSRFEGFASVPHHRDSLRRDLCLFIFLLCFAWSISRQSRFDIYPMQQLSTPWTSLPLKNCAFGTSDFRTLDTPWIVKISLPPPGFSQKAPVLSGSPSRWVTPVEYPVRTLFTYCPPYLYQLEGQSN